MPLEVCRYLLPVYSYGIFSLINVATFTPSSGKLADARREILLKSKDIEPYYKCE